MRFENPYWYPQKITDPKYFYGRTKEIKAIHAMLTQPSPELFVSLVGERRIGKSSLLECPQLFELVGKERPSDCLFINVNMEFVVGGSIKDFFGEICFQIEDHMTTLVEGEISEEERFESQLKQLQEQSKRLVLLLDEFQIITESTEFDEEFFQFLTDVAEKYDVSYIVASPDSLENLCHNDEIKNLPFVKNMKKIYLGSLTEEEAKQLIVKPANSIEISLESEVDFVIDYAGYFPFFIQMLCYHLVREEKDRNAALRQFRREAEAHMRFILTVLDERETNTLKKLTNLEELEPSDTEMLKILERKGYVIQREGKYRVFSRFLTEML